MLIKKQQNKFTNTLKHGSYFASFHIDIIYTEDKANVVAAAIPSIASIPYCVAILHQDD